MLINIGKISKKSEVLGPGKRYVIWVQGCIFRCEGCYNTEYQPLIENQIMDTEDIIKDILEEKENIEGVTFLGGEPLLQAKQLAEIAYVCKKNNLSTLCYTGFENREILELNNENINKLLKYTDVLIDGKYIKEQRIDTGYRGSSNQNIIFLSKRYKKEDFNKKNSYEIEVEKSKVIIKGFYK